MQRKILVSVVEDDQFFRQSMRRLLLSLGYPVEVFPSAIDFLAWPRLLETTCLIADVQMPGMSGLDLHKTLVNRGHTIPTVLVTAYPNDIDRARAEEEGVVCYLSKPVDETRLVEFLGLAHGPEEDAKSGSARPSK